MFYPVFKEESLKGYRLNPMLLLAKIKALAIFYLLSYNDSPTLINRP